MEDMRIGSAILKEALELEDQKQERVHNALQDAKAAADAQAEKVARHRC